MKYIQKARIATIAPVMAMKGSKKKEKTTQSYAEAYVKTMKNSTRAAIFDQLYRKSELTATEIAKNLGKDVDVVYYHMKFLKKIGLVSEPRVEVRDNYIEKYYSLAPEAKQSFTRGESEKVTREIGEMKTEEFRHMLMAGFALIQSATAGAASQIKQVDERMIAELKKKRNITIRIIRCNKERYYDLLKTLTEVGRAPTEVANNGELDYMIAFWAMPKLEEE
ncbi:ArsR family transcriptional regulator [Candidatus Bathyarchaeota archaeon]|nr:ArsR family transcriptional regulator [Candidatus Bathyarchaeota archaeon]